MGGCIGREAVLGAAVLGGTTVVPEVVHDEVVAILCYSPQLRQPD